MTDELKAEINSLTWYHEIEVEPGFNTKPVERFDDVWSLIQRGMDTIDFKDKMVLDVGTRDGKWAFQAEDRGAKFVAAIDNNRSPGALLLRALLESKILFLEASIYDWTKNLDGYGKYDIVLMFGVLYHLRYPMLALKRVSDLVKHDGMLYIETAIWNSLEDVPLLYCPVRQSPYEVTSCTFFNRAGLEETLWSFGFTMKYFSTDYNGRTPRAWITACKTHETPPDLDAYWNSVHKSHST